MKGLVGLIGIFVIVSIPPPTFGVPSVQCAQTGAYNYPSFNWIGNTGSPFAIGAERFYGNYSGAMYSNWEYSSSFALADLFRPTAVGYHNQFSARQTIQFQI